ncbi:uncharacterized protein LOC121861224 isoform X2 [Homarus americanus]|uniref:uncharacterized protein LOC121861224 isoform X2 n=1 Tax=Homarus americanus TaxID=6706 RepID=UPI001C45C4CA|nr:uncharacterized protein LOC121861224 isoform X2 [Homarus americanus]
MAGAALRVSGVGEGSRGRRAGASGRKSQQQRSWWLYVCLSVVVFVSQGALGAAAGDRSIVNVGDSSRMTQCPSVHEIAPCACRVMTKGLDIVCDNADQKHVRNALDVLKKNHNTIYWMKFRSCNLQRLSDYLFLGLDVRHLNIIRSNVSTIERSSLSALGSNLLALDLSNNNIRTVSKV